METGTHGSVGEGQYPPSTLTKVAQLETSKAKSLQKLILKSTARYLAIDKLLS